MKKCFFILFVFCSVTAFAQSSTNYDTVKLGNDSDYTAANKYALEASNFILSTPFDKSNAQLSKAGKFLLKWMSGTPDFTFSLDGTISEKVIKGNDDLLGIYIACMTKYCLENKANAENNKLVKLNSIKLILAYCENPKNNITMPAGLKKLSEANKKGELEKEF